MRGTVILTLLVWMLPAGQLLAHSKHRHKEPTPTAAGATETKPSETAEQIEDVEEID